MNPCGQVFVRTYAFLSLGQILTSGMPRCMLCLVTAQAPPGSSDHGDSPGKNTGVGCHALFQGIFPTQGSNPGILHCRWILYHLSHQGSPVVYVYLKTVRLFSQVALVVKNPPANAGDIREVASTPGSGRSPEEGNSNPQLVAQMVKNLPAIRDTWV